MLIRSAIAAILFPALFAGPAFAQKDAAALASLKTTPERTNFHDTSRYRDVVDFMDAVAQAAPGRVHLTTFGETPEKRALPLAVVGAASATPEAVRATGKLRVYIQGNIHGGEVEGKEAAQTLLRDLAAGRRDDWLNTMVFLIAPIYNADGNERIALNNRGRQHGPLGGQGQRPNAQGLDLNRDHMKLDSPEARAVVRLLTEYDPHVSMDLHTTNGTRHAYHLTYAPPLNPATDPGIVRLLRGEWLPAVTRAVREKHGWDFYYYGNIERGGRRGGPAPERAWKSFDSRPRFNNNYIGLRNRIAILSEAFAYATFEDRILATTRFIEENLNFIQANAQRVRDVVAAADRAPIVGMRMGLRAQLARGETVEILLGEVEQEKHPVDGHVMERRKNVRIPERMPEFGTFEATETERVPATYYLPARLTAAADKLRAHGIRLTPLAQQVTLQVEEFQISGDRAEEREFQGHRERTLEGRWAAAERELPAGTLQVDVSQPLGRLAFYLLEPRSDDGLVNWNVLDEALGDGVISYPVLRSKK